LVSSLDLGVSPAAFPVSFCPFLVPWSGRLLSAFFVRCLPRRSFNEGGFDVCRVRLCLLRGSVFGVFFCLLVVWFLTSGFCSTNRSADVSIAAVSRGEHGGKKRRQ